MRSLLDIQLANQAFWSLTDSTDAFTYDAYMHLDTYLSCLNEANRLLCNCTSNEERDSLTAELKILEAAVRAIFSAICDFAAATRGIS